MFLIWLKMKTLLMGCFWFDEKWKVWCVRVMWQHRKKQKQLCLFLMDTKNEGETERLELGNWNVFGYCLLMVFFVWRKKQRGKGNEGSLYLLFFCFCVPLTFVVLCFFFSLGFKWDFVIGGWNWIFGLIDFWVGYQFFK